MLKAYQFSNTACASLQYIVGGLFTNFQISSMKDVKGTAGIMFWSYATRDTQKDGPKRLLPTQIITKDIKTVLIISQLR